MSRQDVIIFGISKVAEIVYSSMIDDVNSNWNPIAFCVDEKYYKQKEKLGLSVVPFEEVEKFYSPNSYKMLIAIGYHDMNRVRAQKCEEAIKKGYELISFIHSSADVASTAKIGSNTIILNNASVGPFSEIGNNVCIYNNATVSHHVTVEDNAWITSGSVVGGNSQIGHNCFLGINCTIGHNTQIGANNFIGTNAVLTKDTKEDAVYIVADTPKYRLNTDQFVKFIKFD